MVDDIVILSPTSTMTGNWGTTPFSRPQSLSHNVHVCIYDFSHLMAVLLGL